MSQQKTDPETGKAKRGANWIYLKVLGPLSVIGGAVALIVWLVDVVDHSNDPMTRGDLEQVMGERVIVDEAKLQRMVLNTLSQERGDAAHRTSPADIGNLEARLISASAQDIAVFSQPEWQAAQLALEQGDLREAGRQTELIADNRTGNQAAQAWRDAAILYLSEDPERAVVALEHARVLDPDSFDTQLALSRAHMLSGGDISEAWGAAQEAVRLASTAGETAAAALALGLAMETNGEIDGAVDAYRKSADILKTLLRADPSDLQLHQVRLEAQKRLYRVLSELGRYDEAEAALNDALDTAHKIYGLDTSIWSREELALLLVWYGDLIHESREDAIGARAAYLEALAIDESIAEAKGNDARAREGLLFPLKRLVDLARYEGDKPAQRDLYLSMLEIETDLNEAEPNSIWPDMMAFRHSRLAGLGEPDAQQHWTAAYQLLADEKLAGRLDSSNEDTLAFYAEKAGQPYP